MTNKPTNAVEGQIIRSLSGFYDVNIGEGTIVRTRARGQFRKTKQKPLVGDWVTLNRDEETKGIITALKPRKNEMQRPPVANIDVAVIVVSVIEPEIPLVLVDRLLVYAESLNIQPLLYLTKWDLLPDEATKQAAEARFERYRLIGYPLLRSDRLAEDEARLAEYIEQRTAVVMGQSGVGKTTLLNHLLPDQALETGEISKALGRGRHTTRHVEIHPVYRGQLIDTPGFSSLTLSGIAPETLASDFPEIWAKQPECKFRGCRHLKEPQCAVKAAVANGTIARERYDHYVAFYHEIEEQHSPY